MTTAFAWDLNWRANYLELHTKKLEFINYDIAPGITQWNLVLYIVLKTYNDETVFDRFWEIIASVGDIKYQNDFMSL